MGWENILGEVGITLWCQQGQSLMSCTLNGPTAQQCHQQVPEPLVSLQKAPVCTLTLSHMGRELGKTFQVWACGSVGQEGGNVGSNSAPSGVCLPEHSMNCCNTQVEEFRPCLGRCFPPHCLGLCRELTEQWCRGDKELRPEGSQTGRWGETISKGLEWLDKGEWLPAAREEDYIGYWENVLPCEGGEVLPQVAQRSCGWIWHKTGAAAPRGSRDPVGSWAAGKRRICGTCVERGQDFTPEPSVRWHSDTEHKGVTFTWSPRCVWNNHRLGKRKKKIQGTFDFYFFL